MKYQKQIVLVLILAVVIVGFLWAALLNSTKFRQDLAINKGKNLEQNINNSQIKFKSNYQNGFLNYSGNAQVPNLCYQITPKANFNASQKLLILNITFANPDSKQACAQHVTSRDFSGQIQIPENTNLKLQLNGKSV